MTEEKLPSKAEIAKLQKEKSFYSACLDLVFAEETLVDRITDVEDELKDLKKRLAKTRKALKGAEKKFEELNGTPLDFTSLRSRIRG